MHYQIANNDTTLELTQNRGDWPDNSQDLIVTSIPFGTQYEYCEALNDFGHNDDNNAFWEQMDFLIPELYRVLAPGRVACIHVKDRIRFGNVTGLGFPTVEPFSDECSTAFRKHGFAQLGRITIDTDVVRENSQTYRLGWTEMVKDGTKMGCGCCEYVLLFRKPQTDTSRGYADKPVTKRGGKACPTCGRAGKRSECKSKQCGVTADDYTLAQWQIDAAGVWKSAPNRLPSPEVMAAMALGDLKRAWAAFCETNRYDLRKHEAACQALLDKGRLPSGWMLFNPASNNPDIWTDINRISTLNSQQSQRNETQHVCPLQIDIIERCIRRYSNPGDTVFDPFLGIGSTAYQALRMGRNASGCELNPAYYDTAIGYAESAIAEAEVPTLFDLLEFTTPQ